MVIGSVIATQVKSHFAIVSTHDSSWISHIDDVAQILNDQGSQDTGTTFIRGIPILYCFLQKQLFHLSDALNEGLFRVSREGRIAN